MTDNQFIQRKIKMMEFSKKRKLVITYKKSSSNLREEVDNFTNTSKRRKYGIFINSCNSLKDCNLVSDNDPI